MSRATELAKCLDLYDDDQTAVHAADELRRLDAILADRERQAGEAVACTTERLTELAKPIATAIAKNCSVAPQLVFPHLFLGLKDLFASLPAPQAVQAVKPPEALEALKSAFAADPNYAWTWHCAAWASAHDEGMEAGAANRAAARFMHMAFDIDTSKNENFSAEWLAAPSPDGKAEQAEAPEVTLLRQQLADMTDDYYRLLREKQTRLVSEATPPTASPEQADASMEVPLSMDIAPKDSTVIRLLVMFEDGSFEDDDNLPQWTIGTNHLNHTGVDEWLFAGWDWTHDRFTQGSGHVIGWLPMLATQPTASNAGEREEIEYALHLESAVNVGPVEQSEDTETAVLRLDTFRPVRLEFGVTMHRDVIPNDFGWIKRDDVLTAIRAALAAKPRAWEPKLVGYMDKAVPWLRSQDEAEMSVGFRRTRAPGDIAVYIDARSEQANGFGPKLAPQVSGFTQPPSGEPLSDSYIQTVPEKCDRIVWRGRYYHLPKEPRGDVTAQPEQVAQDNLTDEQVDAFIPEPSLDLVTRGSISTGGGSYGREMRREPVWVRSEVRAAIRAARARGEGVRHD